jgi:hypothetical protein
VIDVGRKSEPKLLVACSVNEYIPAVVGVPEMVLPDKVSPGGRLPDDTE